MPIHRGVYFVDVKDPIGRAFIEENLLAKCMYDTGEIFCLYDYRIPLTSARLVHEFVHRAARRKELLKWVSGIDHKPSLTALNEVLTEYITKCILGSDYEASVSSHNTYVPKLEYILELEKETSRKDIVEAYFNGEAAFFRKYMYILRRCMKP